MRIVVASGKGGTGKTTVATGLALVMAQAGPPPLFLDCDVEAPNAHFFLKPALSRREDVNLLIPQVDLARCTFCGRCAEVCQYHAIAVLNRNVMVFPELCHGCGSCTLNCPERAITETPHVIGVLEAGQTPAGIDFARGLLNIGEPMASPVIRALKKWRTAAPGQTVIVDAPPGTSCPVVEAMHGADLALLVTEPTPFGLHDLRLAVELARHLSIPAAAIINRDGIGDDGVERFCREAGLPVLMRIPFDRELAAGLARGRPLPEISPAHRAQLGALAGRLLEEARA
ncbi:MAG: ATP-binding protein [Anaerolineae bacterium]|nr:ATP-binding protein [Anaerolineae bacterium]